MLINKWMVIDSFDDMADKDWKHGFCLELPYDPGDISGLYSILQQLPPGNPFAILLSEKSRLDQEISESYIETIISLFFQPSYFMESDVPVIFLGSRATPHSRFFEKLSAKCMNQGLPVLIFKAKSAGRAENIRNQVYEVRSSDLDYDAIIESWLSQYLVEKDPGEIHLLFRKDEPGLQEIFKKMQEKEMELYKTRHFKLANLVYKKQKLVEEYKNELDLKISAGDSAQLYLGMQKKQTADNVEWYYYEYEILPAWYKRFGHIIKVIMGKRTFRSLFSDNVKKYKD